MRLGPYKNCKRERALWRPCEQTGRRQLSTGHQELNLPAPWPWTSQPPKLGEKKKKKSVPIKIAIKNKNFGKQPSWVETLHCVPLGRQLTCLIPNFLICKTGRIKMSTWKNVHLTKRRTLTRHLAGHRVSLTSLALKIVLPSCGDGSRGEVGGACLGAQYVGWCDTFLIPSQQPSVLFEKHYWAGPGLQRFWECSVPALKGLITSEEEDKGAF